MSRKAIIGIVIALVVIIIAVVIFFIYRNNKKKKAQQAQMEMDILQQQLSANPNMSTSQRGDILGQIAALAAVIAQARQEQGGSGNIPSGPLPGLGGPGYQQPSPTGFPLVKGASGNYVKSLQMAINAKCGDKLKSMGMLPLTTDGKFGPLTERGAAVCLGTTNVSWPQFQSITA